MKYLPLLLSQPLSNRVVYFETNFAKVSEPEGCLELLDVHCCIFQEWA